MKSMSTKFDHVMTVIIESHHMCNKLVVKLQGSIESHMSRNFEKTKEVRQ